MRIPVALAVLAVALAARAAPLKIGVINSMTGPEAPIGEHLTNGVKLAIVDLKAKGIDVQPVWEDDRGKPQVGVAAAEKLATRDGVVAILGAYSSSVTSAVARAAERFQVPLLAPVAAKQDITRQGYQWVYRLSATTDDYAAILLEMALALGQPRTIAILNENSDYGVSGAAGARAHARRSGLRVVFEEAYSKGAPDHRTMLRRLRSANPDLVFLVSYVADAVLLMRQARELGVSPQAFLGAGGGFATLQFSSEREISHGVFSCTQWTQDVPWPGARMFADRYERQFGSAPTYHAATAYSSMMILGEVAARAGGDRARVRKELDAGEWKGIDGPVRFADADGFTNQNRHPMLVEQIQHGRRVTVWPRDLASGRPIWPFPGWR